MKYLRFQSTILGEVAETLSDYARRKGYRFGTSRSLNSNHVSCRFLTDDLVGYLLRLNARVIFSRVSGRPLKPRLLSLYAYPVDYATTGSKNLDLPLRGGKLGEAEKVDMLGFIDGEISRLVLEKASKLSELSAEIELDDVK